MGSPLDHQNPRHKRENCLFRSSSPELEDKGPHDGGWDGGGKIMS